MRRLWLVIPLLAMGQGFPAPGPGHSSYGAAATPVTQILMGGSNAAVGTGAVTLYGSASGVDGANALQATAAPVEQIVLDGTISDLYAEADANVTTGTYTVTLVHCPAETACGDKTLACTIANGTRPCSDTNGAHAFTVAAGDRIAVKVTSAASATSRQIFWGMKWTGTNSNESMAMTRILSGNSNTSYSGMVGGQSPQTTTATDAAMLTAATFSQMPTTAFTMTGIYARALDAVSSGCKRVNFFKSAAGVPTLDANFQMDLVTEASTTHSDLTGTGVTFAVGDGFGATVDPANNGACSPLSGSSVGGLNIAVTLRLTHTGQDFLTTSCSAGASAVTRYSRPSGSSSSSATETAHQIAAPGFTIKSLRGVGGTAPGAGNDWFYDYRDSGGNVTGSTCNMDGDGGTPTICSATPNVALTAGHLFNWIWTVGGSPGTNTICITYTGHG